MDDSWKRDSRYETDFHGWANEQAALLRARRFAAADIENIAEEIATLGRSERRELVSRLAVLLGHLLKWHFQPSWRGKSWRGTIKEQRRKIERHLNENPSLRPSLADAIADAYKDAMGDITTETPLTEADLPAVCPYTQEQIFNSEFWPD